MEEISPQGTAARRLLPFRGGLSALGLLILVSSIAMHLSPRTGGSGGTMFAIGALAVAYLLLWLRNERTRLDHPQYAGLGDEANAKIVDATGKSLEYRDAPISSREFKAEFADAVTWAALHPTLLGGGIVIVALVLAIGIPIAWALLSKQ